MTLHPSQGDSSPAALQLPLANLAPATPTPGDRDRLLSHWQSLRELGFELTLHRDSLEVRHPGCAFEALVQFTFADDLGELREVFRALRAAFGGRAERWMPWLVRSSPTVAAAYQDVKEIVQICQTLRRRGGQPSRGG